MSNTIAWSLFILGIAHIAYGLLKFKKPLSDALSEGFYNRFEPFDDRKLAFWFVLFGLMLMLAGHAAIHAVTVNDLNIVKIISYYAGVISLIGLIAFPKSPFSVSIVIAILLIAVGYGFI